MCHKKANFLQKTFSIKSFNSMLLTFELKEKLKFEYLIKIKKKINRQRFNENQKKIYNIIISNCLDNIMI